MNKSFLITLYEETIFKMQNNNNIGLKYHIIECFVGNLLYITYDSINNQPLDENIPFRF